MTALRYEYTILVGRSEKAIFGLPRFSWKVAIKIDFEDRFLGMGTEFIWFRIGSNNGIL